VKLIGAISAAENGDDIGVAVSKLEITISMYRAKMKNGVKAWRLAMKKLCEETCGGCVKAISNEVSSVKKIYLCGRKEGGGEGGRRGRRLSMAWRGSLAVW